jgi:hypothetical protein
MSDQELRAHVELRALVEEYAWRVDRYDYEGVADLFTPDGEFSAVNAGETEPFLVLSGRQELEGLVHGNDQFARTFHTINNHRCSFEGEGASGSVYCTAHHLLSELEATQTLVMLLRYHDKYMKAEAGWRFASRRLEFAWVQYLPSDTTAYPFSYAKPDHP